jgi:MFS family permease
MDWLRNHTFRSLRHRDFRVYFFGQLVSFTGSWIQSTALMWLAYSLTNDPRWPAYMLVAQVGPTTLLGPLGGSVADRWPKRSVVLWTQAAFMCVAAILALVVAFDAVTTWLLLALQLLSGVVQAFDIPARLSLVPELVEKDDLVNAVGLGAMLFNSARAIGPAIAGLVFLVTKSFGSTWGMSVDRLGTLLCLLLNTVSFTAILFAVSRLRRSRTIVPKTATTASFWDGYRYLAEQPFLKWLLILTGIFSVFAWPILTLFPPYTRTVLKQAEETYSLLLSAFGAGALSGALSTATFGSAANRNRNLLLGAGIGMVGLVGLASTSWFPLAAAWCVLLGIGVVLYLSTGQATLQSQVPDALRGRVMAFWPMMLSVSSLPGHLLGGWFASQFAVPYVLWGMFVGVGVSFAGLFALTRIPHEPVKLSR